MTQPSFPPDMQFRPFHDHRPPFRRLLPIGCGAVAGLLMRLIFWGDPGAPFSAMLSSFIVGSPALVGMVTVYVAERTERRSWGYYFLAPAMASMLYVLGSLLVLIEGLICAIVILPLFALVGGISGLLMGAVCRITNFPRRAVISSVAVLPLLGGTFEHRLNAQVPERSQEVSLFIEATPAEVWRELVEVRDIRPEEVEDAWMYRIGVPVPRAGLAATENGRHLGQVTMGKGIRFDQVAAEWHENERVTWRYRFQPDSFPPGALDDHVRIGGEYFDLIESRYSLEPRGGGTMLTLRSRYRVSTHFNWYAGPVADFLIEDFSEVILGFYARRAERDAKAQPATSS